MIASACSNVIARLLGSPVDERKYQSLRRSVQRTCANLTARSER